MSCACKFCATHGFFQDIPNDPYCTPGFITAFRMLSPLREPAYAATAQTVSGSLCELERVIGDSLFTGYVGYNGRAPGGGAPKKDDNDSSERNKTGGDARHTLVAYFEIVELGGLLGVDRETVNLAIRIFRHTASNTSLRNRNVESLATASFVAASERRYEEYQKWLKSKSQTMSTSSCKNDASSSNVVISDTTDHAAVESSQRIDMWPIKPRQLSVDEVSTAANLEVSEVQRYLKVVNTALRKQKQEGSSSIMTHMPAFCRQLDLPQRARTLAMDIVDRIVKYNVCHRRNPISVAAAAIYLACQLDSVRKTQTEICRVTSLTEVTLRKVYKELNVERKRLIPDWFKLSSTKSPASNAASSGLARSGNTNDRRKGNLSRMRGREFLGNNIDSDTPDVPSSLIPPPLPPGFGKGAQASPSAGSNTLNAAKSTSELSAPAQPPLNSQKSAIATKDNNEQNAAALLTMFNASAVQAFTNVMSQLPQMMMPPPPPPLPLADKSRNEDKSQGPSKGGEKTSSAKTSDEVKESSKPAESLVNPKISTSTVSNTPTSAPPMPPELPAPVPIQASNVTGNSESPPMPASVPVPVPAAVPVSVPGTMPDASAMAGLQSMMGMMQMMLQTAQQMGINGSQGSTTGNPLALMTAMMSQFQDSNGNASPIGPSQASDGTAKDNDSKETPGNQ